MGNKEEKDYSAQSRFVIERKERERQHQALKVEAAEDGLKKLLKTALKDGRTRQNIARDCLRGVKGEKSENLPGSVDRATGRLLSKEKPELVAVQEDGEAGILDRSITGYETRYWEEDD